VIQCCSKPHWQNLSFEKIILDTETKRTHLICLHCRSHVYGEGEGKFWTRKQWDDWINVDGELGESESQRSLFA